MFDWEEEIALHSIQGNQASSCGKGEVSWVFSSSGRNLGYILEIWREWPIETRISSAKTGLCLVTTDNLGIETRRGMTIQTHLELRLETKHSFLVGTVIF